MIYVNEKLPDLKSPEWKFLKDGLENIRKMPNPLRIKITRLPVIEKGARPGINPTGVKEPVKTFQWPLRETVIREGMTETWIYAKNKPTVKDGELIFRTRYFEVKDGLLTIDTQSETDLAYFILNVSTFLKKRNFIVEDLENEAKQQIESISPEAMILFYLNSPISPIYNKNEVVRELAYSWGIPNADNVGINQLKVRLKDTVLSSERNKEVTNRGITEFIEEIGNMGRMTKYRALLQKAKDQNLIGFDNRSNSWCWISRVSGEFNDFIVPILPVNLDQKERLLFEYLINNVQLFDQIEDLLANKPFKENITTIETKYSNLLWTELREIAKNKGINTKGMKREEIEQELLSTE